MNQELIIAIAGALITWGATQATVKDLKRRIYNAEQELLRQNEVIHKLRDVYVDKEHFNELMAGVKEDYRELKADMKKVIEILTSRP